MEEINHNYLVEKQRIINNSDKKLPFNLDVKIRRSLSWVKQAELIEDSNSDNRFLFYWIAFNALYSSKIEGSGSHVNEHDIYKLFFDKLLKADKKKRIFNMIWGRMKPKFVKLITNKYLFGYFWKFHNNELEGKHWEPIFQSLKSKFDNKIKHNNVAPALADVFSRLYVLRNQIIHGGSTWGGDRTRNQVKICSSVIGSMVPLMIDIMLDSPENDWGELHYPILDKKDNRLSDLTLVEEEVLIEKEVLDPTPEEAKVDENATQTNEEEAAVSDKMEFEEEQVEEPKRGISRTLRDIFYKIIGRK